MKQSGSWFTACIEFKRLGGSMKYVKWPNWQRFWLRVLSQTRDSSERWMLSFAFWQGLEGWKGEALKRGWPTFWYWQFCSDNRQKLNRQIPNQSFYLFNKKESTFFGLITGNFIESNESADIPGRFKVLSQKYFEQFGESAIKYRLVYFCGIVPGLERGLKVRMAALELLWDNVKLIWLHGVWER